MKQQFLTTSIGKIAVYSNNISNSKTPLIFLHGVYFDHTLWDKQVSAIHDRLVITIDMPLHGESQNVNNNWDMESCGQMLLEILEQLGIKTVIAIGHSWGSMTILRTASVYPDMFASIGFCNMPFEKATMKNKLLIRSRHLILPFRKFYTQQVIKSLFAKSSLESDPKLGSEFAKIFTKINNKSVTKIDKEVLIKTIDTNELILNLQVPTLALKGTEDYVPIPPNIDTKVVKGGHISPWESTEEVNKFCEQVIQLGS